MLNCLKTILFALIFFVVAGFSADSAQSVFFCNFNGKDFSIDNFKAKYRTITGGHNQLSLSNDKFETFIFLNPDTGKIDLSSVSNRVACVRYVDPGTKATFKPVEGYVHLEKIDLDKNIVHGTFEMVLKGENGKKIEVKNGSFRNITLEKVSHR